MNVSQLPLPIEKELTTSSPCDQCLYFRGLAFFGVPLLCQLHHEGHDWQQTDCEDFIQESKDYDS